MLASDKELRSQLLQPLTRRASTCTVTSGDCCATSWLNWRLGSGGVVAPPDARAHQRPQWIGTAIRGRMSAAARGGAHRVHVAGPDLRGPQPQTGSSATLRCRRSSPIASKTSVSP